MSGEFSFTELQALLKEIDDRLTGPATVIVVGGAYAMLAGAPVMSDDVDVIADPEFWAACDAIASTGTRVAVNPATLTQPPYDYEDRLSQFQGGAFRHLKLAMPEVHDWAIMKLARGDAHDIEHIAAVHARTPLQLDVLVERFKNTLHIGSRAMFELALLDCVEQLFGATSREDVEKNLAGDATPRTS